MNIFKENEIIKDYNKTYTKSKEKKKKDKEKIKSYCLNLLSRLDPTAINEINNMSNGLPVACLDNPPTASLE